MILTVRIVQIYRKQNSISYLLYLYLIHLSITYELFINQQQQRFGKLSIRQSQHLLFREFSFGKLSIRQSQPLVQRIQLWKTFHQAISTSLVQKIQLWKTFHQAISTSLVQRIQLWKTFHQAISTSCLENSALPFKTTLSAFICHLHIDINVINAKF